MDSPILPDDPNEGKKSIFKLVERVDYWGSVRKACRHTEQADKRFSIDSERTFRYIARPLHIMVPLGTIGVLLFVLQHFVPARTWYVDAKDYTGYIRLLLILAGAYCLFLAWPRYRDMRVTDEEEAQTEEFRERLRRLRH